MPRYQIPVRANLRAMFPDATAFVWWDTTLQTCAGQVMHMAGPADEPHMVVTIGTTPGALPTPHALQARLWPWAEVDGTTLGTLAHDQAARPHTGAPV
jgi:hypothetical protein